MENNELKPCPFCGGEAELESFATDIYFVKCKMCGAIVKAKSWGKDEIIKTWNRRDPEDELKKQLAKSEQLRKIHEERGDALYSELMGCLTELESRAQGRPIVPRLPNLSKFKDENALLQAYKSLEAEFTRRSQRLRELEAELASRSGTITGYTVSNRPPKRRKNEDYS